MNTTGGRYRTINRYLLPAMLKTTRSFPTKLADGYRLRISAVPDHLAFFNSLNQADNGPLASGCERQKATSRFREITFTGTS
jgi:hypothetical protein